MVARAQNGDREAVENLLASVIDQVHAVCYRMVGPNEADDATQRAMIAIARGLSAFRGSSKFETWCYRVATNACLDEIKAKKRRPVPSDDQLVEGGFDPTEPMSDSIDLEAALGRLDETFRAPLVLYAVTGLSYEEISTVLEVPAGTVRSRISRGRQRLSELMSNEGTKPEDQSSKEVK
jgi:RNA polymerase sigma-70 factor (ECF subfamily)